jgi:transmembrane sensor
MTVDEIRVRLQADTPPWDDVRERRVLATILSDRRAARRWARPRRWVAAFGVAAGVVVAALWMAAPGRWRATRSEPTAPARPPAVARVPVPPVSTVASPSPSRVVLPDGSQAVLSEGAQIDLERSLGGDARVTVRQSGGRVRYEVRHDPAHPFLVHASRATVRVLGTIFTVAFGQGRVAVSVDEGRVEISVGRRRVRLQPGDELVVPDADETAHGRRRQAAAGPKSPPERRQPPEPGPAGSSVDAWLSRADDARRAGNPAAAANALRALVDGHPEDARVPAALFTLGTVEQAAGHPGAAAAAFARCRRRAPDGTLAEDALAAEAIAWRAANDPARARTAAAEYVTWYPRGTHVAAMRELAR